MRCQISDIRFQMSDKVGLVRGDFGGQRLDLGFFAVACNWKLINNNNN